MIKDVVIALLTVKINEFDYVVGDVLNKRVVINELSGILDYVADIPEEDKNIEALKGGEIDGKTDIFKKSMS